MPTPPRGSRDSVRAPWAQRRHGHGTRLCRCDDGLVSDPLTGLCACPAGAVDSGHILEDEVGICTSCADAAAHFDAALQHAQAKWQTLYENTQELLACFTSCAAAGEGAPAATCYDFTGGPCASLYQVWEVNSTAASTAYGLALDWYYAMSIGGCPNLPPPPLPFAFPGLPSIPGVPPPQLSPFPVPPAPLPTPG